MHSLVQHLPAAQYKAGNKRIHVNEVTQHTGTQNKANYSLLCIIRIVQCTDGQLTLYAIRTWSEGH